MNEPSFASTRAVARDKTLKCRAAAGLTARPSYQLLDEAMCNPHEPAIAGPHTPAASFRSGVYLCFFLLVFFAPYFLWAVRSHEARFLP